ncbi:MAG TPA: hypothetical protein VII58_06480 [Acidobacteriaceae bacterium]
MEDAVEGALDGGARRERAEVKIAATVDGAASGALDLAGAAGDRAMCPAEGGSGDGDGAAGMSFGLLVAAETGGH